MNSSANASAEPDVAAMKTTIERLFFATTVRSLAKSKRNGYAYRKNYQTKSKGTEQDPRLAS